MLRLGLIEILNGYARRDESGESEFISKAFTGSVRVSSRSRLARKMKLILGRANDLFAYTSTRAYGAFFLSFGLLSLVFHLAADYLFAVNVPMSSLIVSVIFSVLGIPFLLFDKPLYTALQSFKPTEYVFFEFFCLRRSSKLSHGGGIHFLIGVLCGFLCATVGFVTDPVYVVLSLLAAVYLYLSFVSPEFSFFITLLSMPYLPIFRLSDYVLCGMVTVTVLSLLVKVILGKRVYYFEQYDAILLLFVVFVLIGGIFVKGAESFEASLVIILLALGYFIASTIIVNRRLADCMINSVVISALPISVYAIVQAAMRIWELGGIRGFSGVSATFVDRYEFASMMLVAAAMCLYFIKTSKSIAKRLVYTLFFTVIFVALVSTMAAWALVAGVFGVIAYILSRLRRGSGIFLGVICVLPYLLLIFSPELLSNISELPVISSLNLYEKAVVWRASVKMFIDNIFIGIGLGAECFREEFADYLPSSLSSYPADSGNLLLEVGIEAGVFALVLLLLIFVVRFRHVSKYSLYVRDSHVREASSFMIAATVCLVVFGAFYYLWVDRMAAYLFWCIIGASGAMLRRAKYEHDDMVGYFNDSRTPDSSSVDIPLM